MEKVEKFNKIIFTGGGSGGHLMIIKGLLDYMQTEKFEYVSPEILVVGGKLGMIDDPGLSLDERLIPSFGFPYKLIRGGKLHRALKWATIKLLFGFLPGLWDSFSVIRKFNPDIIFATGGYVCLPMILVGWLLGKKIILHEQTVKAGLANRIGGIFAHKILLTFEESRRFFPGKKSMVVGNLIRDEVINARCRINDLAKLIENAKTKDKRIIYITGGSLGAHKINEFIRSNIVALSKRYVLIWQTGDNRYHSDYQNIRLMISDGNYKNMGLEDKQDYIIGNDIYIAKFIKDEIGYILQNSDIVVARPGANTLYELAVLGKKAILIPLWVTSQGDQKNNALWFEKNFSAKIIEEKTLTIEKFQDIISILLQSKTRKLQIDYRKVPQKIWQEIMNLKNI